MPLDKDVVHIVTETQDRRPAATKANTRGAGAAVKASGLFVDAGHLDNGGPMSQSPSLHLSGHRDFYKEGKGNRTEIKGGG